VVRLLLAGVMQAGFLLGLITLFRLAPHDLGLGSVNPVLILLGVPLGVAEAALATYVGFVGCRVAELRGGDTPQTLQGWLTVARGGWIRYYLRTASVAPTWLLVGATVLYVAGEELVFRGVVLHAADGWGAPAALLLSVALFTTAQVFYTPNWRTAMFPVLGAVVLGIVHGCLFLTVPDVTPLIVAHAVMFLVTVL
jgi:membrane protease YdiL (CAAX protease family)